MNRFLQLFHIPDLRRKALVILGILVAFRVLAAIPVPGVDAARLADYLSGNQFAGLLNIFSGGGLDNISIVLLGIGPYITATIIMQLLTIVFPNLKQMYYEDGARGQAKFNQISRLITLPLALMQGFGLLTILVREGVMASPSFGEMILNVIVVAGGSMLTLWFGELMSEQKLGNGISLIIAAGILSGLPNAMLSAYAIYTPVMLTKYLIYAASLLVLVGAVVYLNEGERRIPVAYARRIRGMKLYGGQSSYLPVKVNQAGMIPLIFAVSVLLIPQYIAQVVAAVSPAIGTSINSYVNQLFTNQWLYGIVYFLLIVIFTYFYSAITFNAEEVSKNLQRGGGFIPGIRPGEETSRFFSRLTGKITFFGAIFLGAVAVLPLIVQNAAGLDVLSIRSASVLIVVNVALETMRQIDSQLSMREYGE